MARLAPLAPETIPELEETFEHFKKLLGYVPNNVLILSRIPRIVKGLAQLAGALWDPASEVDRGLKRLVAYMASKTHGSDYSMAHAADAAHRAGISAEKIDAVTAFGTSPLFTDAERAALEFAVAAASQPNAVTDGLFDRMKEHWTERQIVEIAAVVAVNGFLNRWNDTVAPVIEAELTNVAKNHMARHIRS